MRDRIVSFCAFLMTGMLLGACAQGSGSGNNTGSDCVTKNDCRPGYDCVDGTCIPENSNNNNENCDGHPVIQVDPYSLVFDEAVVGSPQTLPVTVTNIGDCNLYLDDVRVEENDAETEFSVGDPSLTTLGPDDTIQLNVTLDPVDTQLDTGSLIIESNDPVSPSVTVDLSSAWIGSPDLYVCVMTGDPAPNNCAMTLLMDFGSVPFASSASKEFYLANVGTGNKVITLEAAVVSTTNSSHDPLYGIELFRMVENPPGSGTWQESPVTLPVDISPSPGVDPDPLALYGRLTFTANTDGFLILTGDSLLLTTTDTDDPAEAYTNIPLTATIDGCPSGTYDLNDNPSDGCEYACNVTNGGVEACDGIDNDCDGVIDSISEPCYDAGDGGCNSDGTGCLGICAPGTRTCDGGSWGACIGQTAGQAEQCNDLDDDCDGVVNNGLDEGGAACGPTTSIARPDRNENGTSDSITGTITTNDEDWYKITFNDNHVVTAADTFDIHITFTSPAGGGNFRMDIMKDGCSTAPVCANGTNLGITNFTWNAAGDDPGSGSTCNAGAKPCTNNTQTLYVRVYKIGGPACESYTLTASNG